jgi:hypothetical protein
MRGGGAIRPLVEIGEATGLVAGLGPTPCAVAVLGAEALRSVEVGSALDEVGGVTAEDCRSMPLSCRSCDGAVWSPDRNVKSPTTITIKNPVIRKRMLRLLMCSSLVEDGCSAAFAALLLRTRPNTSTVNHKKRAFSFNSLNTGGFEGVIQPSARNTKMDSALSPLRRRHGKAIAHIF